MKSALVIFVLFLCGCATTDSPRAPSVQTAAPLPELDDFLTTPMSANVTVFRLIDSRLIQSAIRQSREEPALSLSNGSRVALGILAGVALIYLLDDDDDDDDCGVTLGLPRPCDFP